MGDVIVRASTVLLLVVADAVFLWMFLATDPLEQIAVALRHTHTTLADAAVGFAAAWRHGMAGNSWIYMPGFFVTAAAVWLHSRCARGAFATADRVVAACAAIGLSLAASSLGASIVVNEFVAMTGADIGGRVPPSSWIGTFRGLYTLTTWSVFVLACRAALVRHTFRPFIAVAVLTAGLVFVRTWTVDDFVAHWSDGVTTGSGPALASFALIFVVSALLVAVERSAQPQPRERPLHVGEGARRDDQQHVSEDGDQVEAR
jgi:hypothetical protein